MELCKNCNNVNAHTDVCAFIVWNPGEKCEKLELFCCNRRSSFSG